MSTPPAATCRSTKNTTVIIVTYNSREVISTALDSLDKALRIIVVDNASKDGTADYVRKHYASIDVISNTENIGFGRANNVGLQRVKTEFALLMNPDARLLHSDTINKLEASAGRYPEAAILAPNIVNDKGEVQLTLPAPALNRRQINKHFNFDMADVLGDVCATTLSGSLMLLRMSAFSNQPWFFDPNIFMYFEDDDICMSARQRGYSCILIPTIKVEHMMGRASPPSVAIDCLKTKHRICAQLYLFIKYGKPASANGRAVKVLVRNLISVVGYGLAFNWRMLRISSSRIQGAILFLTGSYKGY